MQQLGDIIRGKAIGQARDVIYVWAVCPHCKGERWVRRYRTKSSNYTGLCVPCNLNKFRASNTGKTHWNWKGGHKGYKLIKLRPDDFFYPMTNKQGYVTEHRLIMAKRLKRCLLLWEIVHHKNGIKGDNRLENLELLPHKRFHLVDSVTKAYIRKLENKIKRLEAKIAEA